MKVLALVMVGIVAAVGCHMDGPRVIGSGKSGTRNVAVGSGKTVPEFKKIEANGAFDVEIKQGPQSDIVIMGDDNIISLVEFETSGDTLKVGTTTNYSTENRLKLEITLPAVEGISVNGSGNAVLTGIDGGNIVLSIAGSGNLVATGKAASLDASIAGSGDIDASALAVDEADASISGSGSIKVDAAKKLESSITGSGSVLYKGAPTIDKKMMIGSGEVRPL